MKVKSLTLLFLSAFSLSYLDNFMQRDFDDSTSQQDFFIELVSEFLIMRR